MYVLWRVDRDEDEEDGHKHMMECPALQEQLNGSDQFTIPKVLRDRGVTMADVHSRQSRTRGFGGRRVNK